MTHSIQDIPALVCRLVVLHGEQGICPTAADWTAILRSDGDQPITLLNLLKFKSSAATDSGSGLTDYRKYSAKVAAAFARAGGKRLFFGKVTHSFPVIAGAEWDAAILTRYPSPGALADMWLDEEFIDAHKHRLDGVERSQVVIMSAMD